jgi:hypothetical protein
MAVGIPLKAPTRDQLAKFLPSQETIRKFELLYELASEVVPPNRGGTGLDTVAQGDLLYGSAENEYALLVKTATGSYLDNSGTANNPAWKAKAALTKVDDTNVTVTLGGTPASSLLTAVSLTMGWTGTLAAARLNANVVQSVVNDTNITGSIAAQALTLGFAGTLAAARLNANVVQAVTNDTNVTGSIAAQNLTLGWAGELAVARGGTGAANAADARTNLGLGSGVTGTLNFDATTPGNVTSLTVANGIITGFTTL